MTLLQDRIAVITGAAQGLGYAIAEAFVAAGASVAIGDIDHDAALAAADKLGGGDRAIGLACDVREEADVDRLIATTVERFGRLDVMVNNAGLVRDSSMRKMSVADFEVIIDVHLKGTWLCTRAASSQMRRQGTGGVVLNMSSISGKVGNPGQTNYSAAKAGIVGLTKAAAKELGFAGIRVNALQPGLIHTRMLDDLSDAVKASRLAEVPLGRFGEPEEVAQVAVFLASDMSSYLTGVTIEISGGRNI